MKGRKAVAGLFLIVTLTFTGIALFADSLGLDDHSGWGRMRTLFFACNLLAGILITCYLLFTKQAESAVASVWETMSDNPLMQQWRNSRFVRPLMYLQKYFFTLPIMAVVILLYVWLISSGTWTTWVSPTRHYGTLAQGFARGRLFMPTIPDPRLAALVNPYDPAIRGDIETPVDVTYYKGKYYLYWGPVPALLLVPVQALLHTRVGDLQLVFFFTCGTFVLLSILVIFLWDQSFQGLPRWMLGLSILLLGTANPTLFMLNNFKGARIYEAAITSGQFFLVAGLLLTIMAFKKKRAYWSLALTGILWALSIGSRLFLIIPICSMILVLACWYVTEKRPALEKLAGMFALGLPLLFGMVCLAWYNWERFGSVTESGLYYQLAGLDLQKNYDILLDPLYFIQNLYNYVLHPFSIVQEFPFVQADYGKVDTVLPSFKLPKLYSSQQITGLLPGVPFTVFAIIPLTRLFSHKYREQDAQAGVPLPWIVATVGTAFLAAFAFLMLFFWAAMRYLQDFMPALLVLSITGFWQGYKTLLLERHSMLRAYSSLAVIIICATIFISMLLAVSMNDARFGLVSLFNFHSDF